MPGRLVSSNARLAATVLLLIVMVAGSIVGSYALGLHALSQSQHQWCDTLNLLTSKPVPKPADPAANPSREGQYQFYVNLLRLRDEFGC